MVHEEDGPCVYVKTAVLRELECERRGLKWQLSRALKASDTRAAELSACEAKVKDLLTIVEMNKSVADRALKQSHGREGQLRAATQECDTLRRTDAQQRQRFIDLALRSLHWRRRLRQQRGAFLSFHQVTLNRSQFRKTLGNLHSRARRQTLRRAVESWKRFCRFHQLDRLSNCSSGCAKVAPILPGSPYGATMNKQSAMDVAYCGVGVYESQHPSPTRLGRWQSLLQAWKYWEALVRRRRRHRSVLRAATKRSLRVCFTLWKSRIRIQRQRKLLLSRIAAKTTQRILQFGLTRLRVRCAEASALEWTQVLKSAHLAMEEEKVLRTETQASATAEIHSMYLQEEHRQRRFIELQARKREGLKRQARKQRCWAILRWNAIRSQQNEAISLRFQQLQHRQRVTRRIFTQWKRQAHRSMRIMLVTTAFRERKRRMLIAKCFQAFVRTARCARQRRFQLGALLAKRRREWVLRSWLRWRIGATIEEHEARTFLAIRQVTQDVEARRRAARVETQRSIKIAFKYQLTCALFLADKRQEKRLRLCLTRWRSCVKVRHQRRLILRKLLVRRYRDLLHHAAHRWLCCNEKLRLRGKQLQEWQTMRRTRRLSSVFKAWGHHIHGEMRSRLAKHRQLSYFRHWRGLRLQKRQRAIQFGHFLLRSAAPSWRRHAFQHWKREHEDCSKREWRRNSLERELMDRVWRRWVAFLVFRLRGQRRQQQKVLMAARSSLQRTIVLSAFLSWQTQWRQVRAREELITCTSRVKLGRTLTRRCFALWRQGSTTSTRRRVVLSRICRWRRLQTLRSKWNRWVRTALSSSVSVLESSESKLHQQMESLARLLGRVKIIRCVMKTWRVIAVDNARRRRQRANFADKRRDSALQVVFRRWRSEITRCPRTLRPRRLHLLLTHLRVAVERGAFKRWERRTQRGILSERDQISAQLLARSEGRVMVMRAEAQAHREQRILFRGWKSAVDRKKTVREGLDRVLETRRSTLLRTSWRLWRTHARIRRCISRLLNRFNDCLKAAAWRKLTQMQHHHTLQVDAARRANAIWHKIQLRQHWNHWKRSDAVESKATALAEAEAAGGALMLAFMDKLAGQHRRKRLQILVFTTWKHRVEGNKQIRRRLHEVLGKRQDFTIGQHFRSWRRAAEWQCQRRERLLRVVNQQQAREIRLAFERWKRRSLEVWHSRQLEQAKQAMAQQRQESAKRIATAKFLSWQRPCLEASFLRWKVHGEQRRQDLVERTTARNYRLLKNVWLSWSAQIHDNKRRSDLVRRLLNQKHIALMMDAFRRWDRWQNAMQIVHDTLLRLARIHDLWQWRRGLQALRQHQQDASRRQSVLAATALLTHNTRQREKQTQLMRNAALALQRKHGVALRERCFQRWRLGVRTSKAVDSLIQRTRSRSEKRVTRRCLIEWRWCIRQKVILRQRISKRQETWGHHRQRRVWRAWMQLVDNSFAAKRLIYDRLVLCALQHSLQGAWGRWKVHTKHIRGLMEAQRVAEWEQATAQRDGQFSSLEDKHERLLLKTAKLQQQNEVLRQRQVAAAAKTLLHVLEYSAFGRKPRIAAAFSLWKQAFVQLRVLQTRLNAMAARQQRFALLRWRDATAQTQSAANVKRVQLDAMEWTARVIHSCATQVLKRRSLTVWKAFTRARRGTKQRLLVAKRRLQQQLLQYCWVRWKRVLDTREQQEGAIRSLQQRKERKVVQQVYWRWRRWHDRNRACRLHAAQRLAILWHAGQQHAIHRCWNRWRHLAIQATVRQVQTKLLLVELEQWKAAGRHELAQLLLLTFSNWKLCVRGERARRDGLTGAHLVMQRQRLLRRCVTSWRRRVGSKRKQMLLARLLQRILRRHCTILLKRALWLWFARVQTASLALMSVARQFQLTLTRHALTTDVPAQIARVAVQELLHLRRQFSRSQQRSAWRLVDVIMRNARRQQLQSAFARLAKGSNTRPKCSFFLPKQTASGRAVVDKLALLLLRRGFQHWKQQYVALAIQEAEAAQQELLHALRHVTSYRQALDPYATTRSGG